MTWRIEKADALTLLRELPGDWVQTCIASPSCGEVTTRTLAMLSEIRRLLRKDGTLWLFLPNESMRCELRDAGWLEHAPPSWAGRVRLLSASVRPVALLTREPSYFHRPASISPRPPREFRPRRIGWHVPRVEQGHEAIQALAGRCVLTTTAQVACGTCGAPFRRLYGGEQLSACAHHNPVGRCLVLDPWYRPSRGTFEAAHRNGRAFLGIVDSGNGERQ
jgi:hypothetical protein